MYLKVLLDLIWGFANTRGLKWKTRISFDMQTINSTQRKHQNRVNDLSQEICIFVINTILHNEL